VARARDSPGNSPSKFQVFLVLPQNNRTVIERSPVVCVLVFTRKQVLRLPAATNSTDNRVSKQTKHGTLLADLIMSVPQTGGVKA
jgi:hypothetical protein